MLSVLGGRRGGYSHVIGGQTEPLGAGGATLEAPFHVQHRADVVKAELQRRGVDVDREADASAVRRLGRERVVGGGFSESVYDLDLRRGERGDC